MTWCMCTREGPALFCWLPKLMGKRVIVTVHGLDWTSAKWQNGIASKCIKLGEKDGGAPRG